MKLLRYPSFYIATPFLTSITTYFLSFNFSYQQLPGIGVLLGFAIGAVLFDVCLKVRLPPLSEFRELSFLGTREAFVFVPFGLLIVIFCVLDLTLFPIPLLTDPTTYATFTEGRNHIRHVSSLCWILVPIALLCSRRNSIRVTFLAVAFLFPILVIDRNRLFASLYSLALLVLLRSYVLPWKQISIALLSGSAMFAFLGSIRTGTLGHLPLPFSELFRFVPPGLQWLLLYASAGVYNFASFVAKDYRNSEFLAFQLLLGDGKMPDQSVIPLDAPTINVGTEFFPFLLAFRLEGVVLSMIALYLMLLWSVKLVGPTPRFVPLLIFIRVGYVSAMSPFAPQAFTFTNFASIGLFVSLWAVAKLLPSRTEMAEVQHYQIARASQ